jgi:A/G-specific adenine glycosylase
MEEYPTVEALASASLEDVLRLWQGLGYYRRAHLMHQTATTIAQMGYWPQDVEALRRLPGIGAYTSAAIASIAFERPVPVVDGNVIRVLSRAFGATIPYDRPEGMRWIQETATHLLSPSRPGDYNQAIMDMGAVVCKPQNPLCNACFWSDRCVARLEGRIADLPAKSRRTVIAKESMYYSVILCKNDVALIKRPDEGIWAGLYEFHRLEGLQQKPPQDHKLFSTGQTVQVIKHALSHRALTIHLALTVSEGRPDIPHAIWVKLDQLHEFPMPRPLELYARELTLKYGRTQQSHAHRQPRQGPRS